jgi:hypothetical protein
MMTDLVHSSAPSAPWIATSKGNPSMKRFMAVTFLLGQACACSSTTIIQQSSGREDAAAAGDDGDAAVDTQDALDDGPTMTKQEGSTRDASFAPLACGANPVTTSPISVTKHSGSPSELPAGGAVADGHYVASAFDHYGATLVGREAADLWISAGRFEWEEDDDNFGIFTASGTIAFAGSDVNLGQQCTKNNAVSPAFAYTASGPTLTLYEYNIDGDTLVITMAKR